MLPKDRVIELLRRDSGALAEAADGSLSAPIPSCPGWHMVDLVVHTGGVHRAQGNIIATAAQEPMGIKQEMFASVLGLPAWLEASTLFGGQSDLENIPNGIVEWFRDGADQLCNVLAQADPRQPAWNWSDDQTVRHHFRMLPIETAIHRWDAQASVGKPNSIAEDLAIDGINHAFEVRAPIRRRETNAPAGQGESFFFSAEDVGEAWRLEFARDEIVVEGNPASREADVNLSGSSSDLLLFLWGRVPAESTGFTGDRAVLERYWTLVPPI